MIDMPRQNMTIRPAFAQDAPALRQLGLPDLDLHLTLQAQGERQIILALQADAPAAVCVMNWQPKYGLYKKFGIPEIQNLYTAPAFRRQGFGAALIAYCEDLARQKGLAQIGISVGLHSGFGAAQRLYIRAGYVPDGQGITYDRQLIAAGEFRPVDDQLCLMMVKDL